MQIGVLGMMAGVIASVMVQQADVLRGEDWSRFRGPNGMGISEGGIPVELSLEKNLLWKVESGKGASSPIVVGGQVFLTAFAGDERLVKCFDAVSGGTLWTKSVKSERKEVA